MSETMENEAVQNQGVAITPDHKKKKHRDKKAAGPRKKIKKRYIVIGILAILLLALFIFSKVTAKDTTLPVTCATA